MTPKQLNVTYIPAYGPEMRGGTADMIIIGAFAARTGVLSLDETATGMRAALKGKKKLFALNERALARGFEWGVS
jgi:Pyruvate/2-oxoacid:ferredoxin oxidoreductase gamma subunit